MRERDGEGDAARTAPQKRSPAARPLTEPVGATPVVAPASRAGLLSLQCSVGNRAVADIVHRQPGVSVQREPKRDDDDSAYDRSRRAKPRNCPPGTRPIDAVGLDRETIHKIKDAIGARPDTWVGVTPDGHVVTGDSEGNAEDHGHVSDLARMGAENIPKWVWGMLTITAAIALIVLFATGVGEIGLILAGVGTAAAAVIVAVLRASGHAVNPPGDTASAETPSDPGDPARSGGAAA